MSARSAAPGASVLDDPQLLVDTDGAVGAGRSDLRAVGDRIETLLDASSAGGILVRERSEELVRLLADLYGGGIERIMEILYEQGVLTGDVLRAMADDDLVASLLLVHGLHPEGLSTRVERALDSVRPSLASRGGDAELVGITDDGVVQLRLLGSADGCGSSAATMSAAVQEAILQAAPEVSGFDLHARPSAPAAGRGLIPLTVVPHRPGRSPAPAARTSEHP